MSGSMSRFRTVDWRRAANVAGLVVLVAVVGLFVSMAVPQAVGADHSYVVQSDSMAPAIPAGSVVFVEETDLSKISVGDVITYRNGNGQRVTHRVIDVSESGGESQFRTKGDANEEADPGTVTSGAVVGRVAFHIPYVGYVVTFAGTRLGIVMMMIVPALILAAMELRDLMLAAQRQVTESDDPAGSENQ